MAQLTRDIRDVATGPYNAASAHRSGCYHVSEARTRLLSQ